MHKSFGRILLLIFNGKLKNSHIALKIYIECHWADFSFWCHCALLHLDKAACWKTELVRQEAEIPASPPFMKHSGGAATTVNSEEHLQTRRGTNETTRYLKNSFVLIRHFGPHYLLLLGSGRTFFWLRRRSSDPKMTAAFLFSFLCHGKHDSAQLSRHEA